MVGFCLLSVFQRCELFFARILIGYRLFLCPFNKSADIWRCKARNFVWEFLEYPFWHKMGRLPKTVLRNSPEGRYLPSPWRHSTFARGKSSLPWDITVKMRTPLKEDRTPFHFIVDPSFLGNHPPLAFLKENLHPFLGSITGDSSRATRNSNNYYQNFSN